MFRSSPAHTFHNLMNHIQKSINSSITRKSSTAAPALVDQSFPNLLTERLYYAEGRQHPLHPLHGNYGGLYRS